MQQDLNKRPANSLLRFIRPDDYQLIAPHIETVRLSQGDRLYAAGEAVETVYFPCGPSLVSFLISSEDGQDVEVIMVGREGAVGGIVSQGRLPAYSRIMVKFDGPFARLRVARLETAKASSPALANLFARYADCMLAQMFQSAACNAIHSIEQRSAKWIVAAIERTGSDFLPLTHEELSTMLGVGRSYTSRVMQIFKAEGILETRRGALVIRDRDALRARACGCNEQVKAHFDDVLRGVYPTPGSHL